MCCFLRFPCFRKACTSSSCHSLSVTQRSMAYRQCSDGVWIPPACHQNTCLSFLWLETLWLLAVGTTYIFYSFIFRNFVSLLRMPLSLRMCDREHMCHRDRQILTVSTNVVACPLPHRHSLKSCRILPWCLRRRSGKVDQRYSLRHHVSCKVLVSCT